MFSFQNTQVVIAGFLKHQQYVPGLRYPTYPEDLTTEILLPAEATWGVFGPLWEEEVKGKIIPPKSMRTQNPTAFISPNKKGVGVH